MIKTKDCILGIDTSNYKTSAAIVDAEKNILCDLRKLLKVKQGERGLRQSDALFQHIENLPALLTEALQENGLAGRIGAVACSSRPRPIEGSYMPVFKAGTGFGKAIAAALQVPYYTFSHQEGHIEAICGYSSFVREEQFLCYHLSGGTCELLRVDHGNVKIIGGSKDLSFGQVIDRVGVRAGMAFPAGEEMDRQAMEADRPSKGLKRIPSDGLFFNLSGIETQCGRQVEKLREEGPEVDFSGIVRELFDKIIAILVEITERAVEKTSIKCIMFTGGVSSSQYISRRLKEHFCKEKYIKIEFGRQQLSQDNAVGIALLGGKRLWL